MKLFVSVFILGLVSAIALTVALTLEPNDEPPVDLLMTGSSQPQLQPEQILPPCSTPTLAPERPSPDPGILAPTPAAPFASRMPSGRPNECLPSILVAP